MMFLWKPDMIRFMRDASDRSRYYERLAAEITPYLQESDRICDAGCGLGYLSLALAPFVREVTSVDINADALAVLRENCGERRLHNIRAQCGDLLSLPFSQPFDAMVFCLFGNEDEILPLAKSLCRGRVFLIRRNYSVHRFSEQTRLCSGENHIDLCNRLAEMQIPFERKELSLEFGQPLRSMEEAKLFYRLYTRDDDPDTMEEAFLSRLVPTGEKEFPYYLPHRREIGWCTFETKDLP